MRSLFSKRQLPLAILLSAAVFGGVTYSSVGVAGAAECVTSTGPTGNTVIHSDQCPYDYAYVPDVAGADARSQEIALEMYKRALEFCIKYPDEEALAEVGYGQGRETDGRHVFSDQGIDPKTTEEIMNFTLPYTAMVIESGRNAGAMSYQESNFPYVGSIGRPHMHDHDGLSSEMFHIFCMPTIEEAFAYDEATADRVPSVEVLKQSLAKANSGGIAAVSSQLAGNAPASTPASNPAPSNPESRDTATTNEDESDEDDSANDGGSNDDSSDDEPVEQRPSSSSAAAVTLEKLNGRVIVSVKGMPANAPLTIEGTTGRASGRGTFETTASGTFKLALAPASGVSGQLKVTATSGSTSATKTVSLGGSAGQSQTAAPAANSAAAETTTRATEPASSTESEDPAEDDHYADGHSH